VARSAKTILYCRLNQEKRMHDRYELPPELTIYGVSAVRDALLAWLGERAETVHGGLEISAHAVTDVDGAGLQLLAALSASGPGWRLVDPSAAFADACRVLGFAHGQ
jgi:anti-anti-sigma regulatory factor